MQHRSCVREKSVPVLHKNGYVCIHTHTEKREREEETLLYLPPPVTFLQVRGIIRGAGRAAEGHKIAGVLI